MKYLKLALLAMLPVTVALADQPWQPSQGDTLEVVLRQRDALVVQNLNLSAAVELLRNRLTDLEKQLATAKAPPSKPKPSVQLQPGFDHVGALNAPLPK